MKFTKSIRWRLLLWIAFLLGLILAALDFTAYEIHFANRVGQLDGELQRRVAALSAALYAPEPGQPMFGNGPPNQPTEGFSPPPLPRDGAANPSQGPNPPPGRDENPRPPPDKKGSRGPPPESPAWTLRGFPTPPADLRWTRRGVIISRSGRANPPGPTSDPPTAPPKFHARRW
jgi:hypothetical protein